MRLVIALILFLVPTTAVAGIPESVTEARERREEIKLIQERCEHWLMVYTRYMRYNRRNLQRLSWDNPDGFIDPSSLYDAHYYFLRVSTYLRDQIDLIQRSEDPTEAECRAAANSAYLDVWNYTRDMILNELPSP